MNKSKLSTEIETKKGPKRNSEAKEYSNNNWIEEFTTSTQKQM